MSLPAHNSFSERLTNVKTKIIATVGPACAEPARLRELVLAGVDVFRLNFAHGAHEWLSEIVSAIRGVSDELRRPLAILGDLAGPKIRLQELPGGSLLCLPEQTLEFAREADPQFPLRLTSSYDKLVDELGVGDRVLIADGTVALRVAEKSPTGDRVVCRVEQGGEIRSRQGINLPGVTLSVPSLTDKDHADLEWAVRNEVDFVGLSFVRSADDIKLLQLAIEQLRPAVAPQVVAKIEKMEAVAELDRILEQTDAVMVARGDLGVEVDIARVPGLQKRIIRLCNQHRIPVITATQMLDSMQRSSLPTRAEASDVVNAILDGSDAIMLSGETAVGQYPVQAVQTMSRLAQEGERLMQPTLSSETPGFTRSRALAVTEAVTHGAGTVAEMLQAELIVVATRTGKTAMAMSKQRLAAPILSLCERPEIARRVCLLWGVTPLLSPQIHTPPDELLDYVIEWGLREKVLQSGSKIVLVARSNSEIEGHDQLLVHAVP